MKKNTTELGKHQLAGSFIVLIAAVILIGALLWTQKGPEAKLEALPHLKVVLVEVVQQDMEPSESITGRLQPIKTAQLKFEVKGRVKDRLVEPGFSISRDQSLLILDDDDLRDQFTQAESQYQIEEAGTKRDQRMLKLAQDNLSLQEAEVERFERLQNDSMISASQLDSARQQMLSLDSQVSDLQYKVSTSEARLSLKKSKRDVAKRNLDRSILKAPFAGYVNEVNVEVGDLITATEIVATIVDTSSLDLQLDVRGKVASALELGQEILVLIGTSSVNGKLIALQPDPDTSTNTHALRIRLPGEKFKSGMLASAELPLLKQLDAITVPVSAVATDAGENHVFVFQQGRLKRISIEIQQRVGARYIVLSGLNPGDLIVARDVSALSDGQHVTADM